MSMTSVKNRLKLAWLALRKPCLFQPALMIDKAVIRGHAECEVTFTHTNGDKVAVSYRLTSKPYQSPMENDIDDTRPA